MSYVWPKRPFYWLHSISHLCVGDPNVRIYYAGQRINGETDDDAKKVIFSIPEIKEKSFFYLLMSSDLEFGSHENTVPYLRLKKGASYKFFALQRVAYEPAVKKRNSRPIEYGWFIQELSQALVDGKIPDETIIVRYNPEYIQSFSGGSMIELPKIIIKPDILTLVGSEEKLHALSNKWFFICIKYRCHSCTGAIFNGRSVLIQKQLLPWYPK